MINKVFLFIFLFVTIASAQNTGTISETINLSLIRGLSLKQIGGNLDFGEALSTKSRHWKILRPNEGARFVVTGYANRRVTVTYTRRVRLRNNDWVNENGGRNGRMTFISHVRRTGKNPNYVNPRRVRSGRRYRLQNSNGIGKLYLWVGGRIRINANQAVGQYIGTFTITVAY